VETEKLLKLLKEHKVNFVINVAWNRVAKVTKKIGLCSTSLAIIGYSIADEEPITKLEELLEKDSMLISPKGLKILKSLSREFKVMKEGNEFRIRPLQDKR